MKRIFNNLSKSIGHTNLLLSSAYDRSPVVFQVLYVLFAGIGATLILGALTFVSLLIGGLINGMIVLLSGPLIDKMIEKRKAKASAA